MKNIVAPLAASLFALLATAPAHAGDNCVWVRAISGFNVIDDQTLIIYTGPNDAYRVNMFGRCPGLSWTESVAVDSRDGRLCWPSNNHIIFSDHGFKQSCPVDSVLRMAPADIDKVKAERKAKREEKKPAE